MRAFLLAIAAAALTGCATTSTGAKTAVYDHKFNQFTFVSKGQQSDFVGTSAKGRPAETAKPAWYLRGHP